MLPPQKGWLRARVAAPALHLPPLVHARTEHANARSRNLVPGSTAWLPRELAWGRYGGLSADDGQRTRRARHAMRADLSRFAYEAVKARRAREEAALTDPLLAVGAVE